MSTLHAVLPEGIDDPLRPSGGNLYDRRVCDGLAALGWTVHEHAVGGTWPTPDAGALERLSAALATLPTGSLVVVDGLVAAPSVMLAHIERLRLVVLVHLPHGVDRADQRPAEAELLRRCDVVATSDWTSRWLREHYQLDPVRVDVVPPGVDEAEVARPSPSGGALLTVGRVTSSKGYDLLGEALAGLADLTWHCVCLGSLDAEPELVAGLRDGLREAGVADRVELRGTASPHDVWDAYLAADLVVVPSRTETYGMVVTEALAHGVPVLAAATGGLPETLGSASDGRRPGLLVRPGDSATLGDALRSWLSDAQLRRELREAALARRPMLGGWQQAIRGLDQALRRSV